MSNAPQEPKATQPMDPSAPEQATPVPITVRPRDCYALTTLITEVHDIWPDIEVETFNPNGRGVNISVAFYDDDEPDVTPLLTLLEDRAYSNDLRVSSVEKIQPDGSEPGYTIAEMVNNPATYDGREPFGLVEAFKILSADEDDEPALIDPEDDEQEDTEEEITKAAPTKVVYISRKTGRAVTETYAKRNPDAVREQVFTTSEEEG